MAAQPGGPYRIEVPFNTMLADLDAGIGRLLRDELAAHAFRDVEVAFEAPTRDWAAGRSAPTLDVFLYDVRRAASAPGDEWREDRSGGTARLARPPVRIECAYAVTAWTRTVENEHQLLSQALAILVAHEELPPEYLGPRLPQAGRVSARIGHARTDGAAEFWSALGAQYKTSVDYVVTVTCDTGLVHDRGPQVRTRALRTERRDTGATEVVRSSGGVVRDATGRPVPGAWLLLPDLGAWARTDVLGRFAFTGVPEGRHRCECRGPDGATATGDLPVPGGLELVL